MLRKFFSVLLLSIPVHVAMSQVATGIYPYGTFDSKGFDTVNVGNLNVHFSVPIINKAGRGLPFWYNLSYDSSVWYPSSVNGSNAWTPVQNFGWRADTEILVGYITYKQLSLTSTCTGYSGRVPEIEVLDVVYHDPFGVSHGFLGYYIDKICPNGDVITNTLHSTAGDGSGYQLAPDSDGDGPSYSGPIVNRQGATFIVPSNVGIGQAKVTDPNGNVVAVDGSGHFTDTTGNTALSVAGSAPNPQTFTYTDANGNPQNVTINYRTYTVQTAFGCSGIGEYGPTSTSLVDNITLPDGSAYHFAYEGTPGISGNVTGRLASVTLPQGGVISYSYTGGSNGVECADGSTAGLTRSVSADSGSAASTWSYSRSNAAASTSHTDVTDGLGNHLGYDFVIPTSQSNFYETNRVVNQGSSTQLLSRQTCYNGESQPCTTTQFTVPISQIDTYETLNGIQQHGSTAKYNSYGLQTEEDDYDFGGSSSRGSLLRKEVWTYGGSIVGLVTEDDVYGGSSNLAGKTTYSYDGGTLQGTSGLPQHISVSGPRGNLTGVMQYANASTTISTSATYEDTGDVLTSTTPNGTTNYAYDSTHAFVTTVTPPTPSSGISLPISKVTDVNTGLLTSTTDPNGTTAIYSYDSMLRPSAIDLKDSGGNQAGETVYKQYSSLDWGTENYQNASTYANTRTLQDGYGRPSRVAIANGQSSNPWYQRDTCYDANGNVNFQAYSYQGGGWATSKVCSGSGDSYSYDALGRVTKITHGDGTSINYTYAGRAAQITDENGVSRITQVDGLGRTTAVCELSNNSLQGDSPTACGLDISGTGYLTSYSYDLANHKTTVTQGAQTRVFQTDWLGRTTVTQEPERGQTTYSYTYNSTGLVVTRQRPTANQANSGVLTTTTAQYDALGRVENISYSDGTQTKSFLYDMSGGWAASQSNLKGRLSRAIVPALGNVAAVIFSYDAVGNVAFTGQCFPYGCGNSAKDKYITYDHDWTGNLTSQWDATAGSIQSTYSPANEVTQVTGSYSLDGTAWGGTYNLITSVQNGPNGSLGYQLGNGLAVPLSYDSLGRLNGGWVCSGSTNSSCSGGTQLYGYTVGWQGLHATTSCDSVLGSCITFGYDDFHRLTARAVNSGPQQSYTYVYDRYGNRWQENPNGAQLSFNRANNHISVAGYNYDAAGNLTSDGVHTYTYDAEGNLTQVDGGATAAYAYDALNRRIRVQTTSTTVDYTFDYLNRRVTTWLESADFGIQGKMYWGSSNQPFAYRALNAQTYFEHPDWLGTERMRTTYNGAVAGSFLSLPFGDGYSVSGIDSDPYHFAMLDHDSETDTHHAQFRQYSSAQGRWMMPDPDDGSYDFSNPQSFNRYSYVLNNPLSFVDPQGLFTLPPQDGGGGDCWWCWDWGGLGGTGGPIVPPSGGNGGSGGAPNKGILHSIVCGVFSGLVNAANPQNLNSTIGVGVGGNAGAGFILGIAASAGVQVVADSSGNLGVAINVGGNPGYGVFGVGAMYGGQASVSTAKSIYDLRGGSVDFGASFGAGPAVTLDGSAAMDGSSVTGTVTVGPGVGTKGSALGIDYTWVPSSLSTNCR